MSQKFVMIKTKEVKIMKEVISCDVSPVPNVLITNFGSLVLLALKVLYRIGAYRDFLPKPGISLMISASIHEKWKII